MSRPRRHGLLLTATLCLLLAGELLLPFPDRWTRLSVASAWLFMLLLCTALLLGRFTASGRVQSSYLRRDIGIWAALNGLLHFAAGNAVAMTPAYLAVYVHAGPAWPDAGLRNALFTWGSIAGLIVAVLLLLLLLLSSDRAIRRVGATRWKRAQRSALIVFWLTLFHGLAFLLLERRWPALLLLLVAAAIVVIGRKQSRLHAGGH